jgi:hypothetical protein
MGSVKRQGAVKIGMEKSDEKGEQKPHIQFLCTAPLYSTKHTVVLIGSAHYTVHNHTSRALTHSTPLLENLPYSYYVQLICTVPNIQLL